MISSSHITYYSYSPVNKVLKGPWRLQCVDDRRGYLKGPCNQMRRYSRISINPTSTLSLAWSTTYLTIDVSRLVCPLARLHQAVAHSRERLISCCGSIHQRNRFNPQRRPPSCVIAFGMPSTANPHDATANSTIQQATEFHISHLGQVDGIA